MIQSAKAVTVDSVPLPASRAKPLKVIVQIPCYNEAETLPAVLREIPRDIPGVGTVEVQVIDDGSTDDTVLVAEFGGADHVIRQKGNKGLARSFQAGIDHALAQGADIIVNTDGDNQYRGSSIPDLVRPIVEGRADIVLGDRQPGNNTEFSALKRLLQRLGSRVVKSLADIDVPDLRGGFSHLIAALTATGTSTVSGVGIIDRGYERFRDKLAALGADFE